MMKLIAKIATTSAAMLAFSATLASAQEANTHAGDADFSPWLFVGIGLTVVIGILVLLAVMTAVIGKIFIALEEKKRKASAPVVPVTSTPSVAPVAEEDDSELVAVLAAAAMAVLDAEVRIVNYKPSSSSWAKEGRVRQTAPIVK